MLKFPLHNSQQSLQYFATITSTTPGALFLGEKSRGARSSKSWEIVQRMTRDDIRAHFCSNRYLAEDTIHDDVPWFCHRRGCHCVIKITQDRYARPRQLLDTHVSFRRLYSGNNALSLAYSLNIFVHHKFIQLPQRRVKCSDTNYLYDDRNGSFLYCTLANVG